jgi:hypothetical protein
MTESLQTLFDVGCARLVRTWAQDGVPLADAQTKLYDIWERHCEWDEPCREEHLAAVHDFCVEIYRKRGNGRFADEDEPGPPSAIQIDDEAWNEIDLPRRDWVALGYALRGAVTIVAGPPSAMKSSLMLTWAIAVGLFRRHGRFIPADQGDVIVYNVEDDRIEQRRRLSAVLRQFDAAPADICGKVIRVGPSSIGTLFTYDQTAGRISPTQAMNELRLLIAERRPALLIADPLAELHTAEENSNCALRSIVAEFRALAVEFEIAVILVHHTRKGIVIPGDPDAARGASSIIGAGRIVKTLIGMSEDDAKALALPGDRKTRSQYVRLDDAKQNYAAIGEAEWYEKVPYLLANGEMVPAAVPWNPPNAFGKLASGTIDLILNKIDAGPYDGGRYSPSPNAKGRAAWPVVQQFADVTDDEARLVIATWIKNGVLVKGDHKDPEDRHDHVSLFIGKRPGDTWEM